MEIDGSFEVKENSPISLEETCVVGSVFFKDYQTVGSEGNVRGKEAIESLAKVAEKGCKAAVIIAPDTDPKFIEDLKERLSTLGDKSENIVWHVQEKPGYSQARREAIELARAKYPDTRAFIMQEIEKDLTEHYDNFVASLSDDRALVMMNRGVNVPYNENPWPDANHLGANLPPEQFWGERHQNIEMANQEKASGFTKEPHYWDRLNGTRVIRNEKIKVGSVEINPSDLMLLKYEYTDGYTEEDRKNKIDTYSAAVYNLIPILEALGGENQMSELPVQYLQSEKQKEQEMDPTVRSIFKEKRLGHKIELPKINSELVMNIKELQREGVWPQVLLDALNGDKILKIKHFKEGEYNLANN